MSRVTACDEIGCPKNLGSACRPILWPCSEHILRRGYEIDHATTRLKCIECREIGGNHKDFCSLHPSRYAISFGQTEAQFFPIFGGPTGHLVCRFVNLRCRLASGEMLNCAPGDQCRNYLVSAGYLYRNGLWICRMTGREFGWRDSPLHSIRRWKID